MRLFSKNIYIYIFICKNGECFLLNYKIEKYCQLLYTWFAMVN